jgi:hypothetical protein
VAKNKKERVLVISDTQFPFQHKDTFKFLAYLKKKYQPTRVVHIGDLFDFHALSDYPTDCDADSVGVEFEKAMVQKEKLEKLFPKMEILESNHDVRFFKRLQKAGIPRRFWPTYSELFECVDGWSFKDKIVIDDVVYIHGHQVGAGGGNLQQNAIKAFMRNTVFGHFHTRFGIDYFANQDALLFGMAVGSLIDHELYAFHYQRSSVKKPIIGTGVVIYGQPILEPMVLDNKGRWVG